MKRILIIVIIGSLTLPSLAQRGGGQQGTVQRGSAFSQETTIVVQERPTREPAPPRIREEIVITPDMLVADGRRMFQGGRELSPAEVRAIMVHTDALRLYNNSLRRNRNGRIFLYSGIGALAGGTLILATQPIPERMVVEASWSGGVREMRDTDRNFSTGIILVGVGLISTVTGLIMTGQSRLLLRQSADSYNRQLNSGHTSMDFQFDLNGTGVSLTLRF